MLAIKLKKSEERRLRTGHSWIFSNEIEEVQGKVEPGALAEVHSASGKLLGIGTYNKASLIACRLLTRKRETIDTAFFARRLRDALKYRAACYGQQAAYRLVYSEGDLLPGFVADRYGPYLCVQTSTAGAERLLPEFLEALAALVPAKAVVLRNDTPSRQLEGLDSYVRVASGSLDGPVEAEVDGLRYEVDLTGGQKTGFYFDQRENRVAAAGLLAPGGTALDLFCYTGSFALTAAKAGARHVTGVDSSGPAVEFARRNCETNGLTGQVEFVESDAVEFLDRARGEGRRWDAVFVDPPAFARTKKALPEALIAYERLNRKALEVLEPGGLLVSSSCSFHVGPEEFLRLLVRAAAPLGRTLRLVELRGQSRDHPAVAAMPETRYLKCALAQAL